MGKYLPRLLRCKQLLVSLVFIAAASWSEPSDARRIVIDFAGENPGGISDTGDIWVPNSDNCAVGDTAPASCGISFTNDSTAGIKLGFSIRIGDPVVVGDPPPLYDTIYINRRGYVTFGSASPSPPFQTGRDLAALSAIISENGTVVRPFLAPFHQDLSIPQKPLNDGGASYFRATADPLEPISTADARPAFAVTWIQADPFDDGIDTSIVTQLVIYSTSDDGDWQLRFRYGDAFADPLSAPYNAAGTPIPGLAGFSLETGVPTDAVTLSDTVTVLAELSTRDDVDYFFTFEDGHLVTETPVDTDGDGIPDATDTDDDNDTILDDVDNCPLVVNANQANNDGDAQGDACDSDDDNDTVADDDDNCPLVVNVNQANNDGDAQGDACDPDDDNDNVADGADNCPLVANSGQTDSDGDGVGDACDSSPFPQRCDADVDGDIDARDLARIAHAIGLRVGPNDPRDFNGNLKVELIDFAKCATRCTRHFCAVR
jgi:hypothetical protein